MTFNPIHEKGMSIERQLRSWDELNGKPYDKRSVHPYTRTRIIMMNGIEVEGALFSHQFARHTTDMELKRELALTRRLEQQQQKAVSWMIPSNETVLENTLGYEQVAVDLTAWLARTEPDPYVKAALDFALLEDFDHLYRYANLMDMVQGNNPQDIIGEFTEITVGRPTSLEHRHPFDEVRKHYDAKKADFLTKLHVMTIIAAEQQTMNFYMNVGNRPEEMLGRGLYMEIAQIEEQHVTHYESLMDPRMSWFEQLLLHEYNEVWLYHSLVEEEVNPQVKKTWERHLDMELGHLQRAMELMRKYENRDPEELLPSELPPSMKFQSNIDYVRQIMKEQTKYNALETEFVPPDKMPRDSRFDHYQKAVNAGHVPSERVIDDHRERMKKDYRAELAGPHPIKEYRSA